MRRLARLAIIGLVLAACGASVTEDVTVTPGSVPAGSAAGELVASESETSETAASTSSVGDAGGGCADVIGVEVTGDGPYTFAVTVASPDTGWEKYADEWRIESESGEVLGVRELTHPHVDEQPFTRSLGGVDVDAGSSVVVAARDSVEGYCGDRVSVTVGG
jgi:hypothetical protein